MDNVLTLHIHCSIIRLYLVVPACIVMKLQTENIYQVIELPAAPARVFDALLDQDAHVAFTGKDALIQPHEGGAFSLCNQNHTGYFLHLVQNKRIVLAWTHKKFPAGHFTTVDMRLSRNEAGQTTLILNHIGVPAGDDGWMTESWTRSYWSLLTDHLQEVGAVTEAQV